MGYVTREIPQPGLGNPGSIAVASDQAGRGSGERMVKRALGWLEGPGCTRIRVVPQARNINTTRLYPANGFGTVSVENSYQLWLGEGGIG